LSLDAPELLTASATPSPAKPRKRDRSRDLRRSHGKVRLLTLDRLDRRTAAAQRAVQLVDAIGNDLGGSDRLSEGTRMLVQRAAVLNTFIESCEVRWLAGESIELGDYLAAINCQRRCLESIGLDRLPRDVTSFGDLLRVDRMHGSAA
jgi:hypothetical protein